MVQDSVAIFKALSHEGRLLILCHLVGGEKSVSELENILDARQSVVSQQLARLRMEGMVTARREGQMIFYSIKDHRVLRLLGALDTILAPAGDERHGAGDLPKA
ncbi:ArsR/SmtB family transcription factor [Paracoccus halophilus]|nr:metalloregulator ArsR/SmtB family transcription factor [Paracoccus halophilus]